MLFQKYETDCKEVEYLSTRTWDLLEVFSESLYKHDFMLFETNNGRPYYEKKGKI
jgi:hypothetical protein